MADRSTHLSAYLSRYADPDGLRAADRVARVYENVLVVPCFDEAPDLLDTLLPADAQQLLVVLVINIPDDASPEARKRTVKLASVLSQGRESSLDPRRNIGLLIIDRVSRPIPRHQGVGLARKIGTDCAAALWHRGLIKNSWIYGSDADVRLPRGYFDAPMPARGAAIFPFRHTGGTVELQHKADLYELHLRYYRNRLEWAGSPYAFHTLGSTLAFHSADYAKVRGYPRRNAGEDFYFLNKLAKVAPIHALQAPTLQIQARYSDRTPFGTGVSLAKMHAPAHYRSYAPQSFRLLRQVLSAFDELPQPLTLTNHAEQILNHLGFAKFLAQARAQYKNPSNLRKAVDDWFDGFRTLRFIHECRRHYPDVLLRDTLAQLYPNIAGQSTSVQAAHFFTLDTQVPRVTTAMGV